MSNIFEKSFLMTLGAAALTRDMAESGTDQLMRHGETRTEEGRQAVNDLVERARDETRQAKGRIDRGLERTFRDMGLVSREQLEDMELKMAQLEHRISLLEASQAEQSAEAKARAEASRKEK